MRRLIAKEHVHRVERVRQPEKPREMGIDLRQPPSQEGFGRREAGLVVNLEDSQDASPKPGVDARPECMVPGRRLGSPAGQSDPTTAERTTSPESRNSS